MGVVLHLHNVAVAAGCHKAEEGRLQLRVGEVQRGNVSAQVVHRHQRLIGRVGQTLGKIHAHQHCTDQARRKGDGHGIHIVDGLACIQQGFFDRSTDKFAVAAAGDLRHNAAVKSLFFYAGGNDVAQQVPAVLHQSCGGLVAGGFNSQNNHVLVGLQPVFACVHIGAQGHGILHAAFHFLPQDLRSLFGFSLRCFHDQFIVDGQDQAAFHLFVP